MVLEEYTEELTRGAFLVVTPAGFALQVVLPPRAFSIDASFTEKSQARCLNSGVFVLKTSFETGTFPCSQQTVP
jgi:hypothetical protein